MVTLNRADPSSWSPYLRLSPASMVKNQILCRWKTTNCICLDVISVWYSQYVYGTVGNVTVLWSELSNSTHPNSVYEAALSAFSPTFPFDLNSLLSFHSAWSQGPFIPSLLCALFFNGGQRLHAGLASRGVDREKVGQACVTISTGHGITLSVFETFTFGSRWPAGEGGGVGGGVTGTWWLIGVGSSVRVHLESPEKWRWATRWQKLTHWWGQRVSPLNPFLEPEAWRRVGWFLFLESGWLFWKDTISDRWRGEDLVSQNYKMFSAFCAFSTLLQSRCAAELSVCFITDSVDADVLKNLGPPLSLFPLFTSSLLIFLT